MEFSKELAELIKEVKQKMRQESIKSMAEDFGVSLEKAAEVFAFIDEQNNEALERGRSQGLRAGADMALRGIREGIKADPRLTELLASDAKIETRIAERDDGKTVFALAIARDSIDAKISAELEAMQDFFKTRIAKSEAWSVEMPDEMRSIFDDILH